MTSISVIIPTHNRADKLVEALQSLLLQTWTDFEIIVVDDGSSDDTPAAVERIRDRRVRYLCCEHGERSIARNLGLKAAEGAYLAFMDDDDLCLPHRLECQAFFLNKHAGVDLVSSGFYIQSGGEPHRTPWYRGINGGKVSLLGSLHGYHPNICCSMIRRSVLEKMDHCFDPNLVPVEDVDFMLRLVLECGQRTAWLPEMVYVYRKRPSRVAAELKTIQIYREVLDKFFSGNNLPPEVQAQQTTVNIRVDIGAACLAFGSDQIRLGQYILLKSLATKTGLKTEGVHLLISLLAQSAAFQPVNIADHLRLVNQVFDHLPSPLKSWQAYRSQALDRVQNSGERSNFNYHAE